MNGANAAPAASMPLTVALDVPSAQVLADQAAIIQDLQFVMECCKRLLTELDKSDEERDAVVPLALWSSALVSYARCFATGKRFGLTVEDVQSLPLEGEVVNYHKWVIAERNKSTKHTSNPFEAAVVGAALSPPAATKRQVEGIAILSMSRVLVNHTGVRQLGGLASELAKQTAEKARAQQDVVLAEAQRQNVDRLYELPPLRTHPQEADGAPDGADGADAAGQ